MSSSLAYPLARVRALARRVRAFLAGEAAERERVRSTFTQVYVDNGWADPESRSGPGSTLARTATLREEFPALLVEFRVSSVLDVGCGDFNWMRTVDLGVIDYLGVDVVHDLIADNARRFAGPRRRFLVLEIASEVPPQADLALCRDCWVHLSDSQVRSAIANLRAAGIRYLLATTFVDRTQNPDVPTGGWRPMNLALPPFRLGPPLRTLSEQTTVEDERYRDKCLGLWELS
jgi:SAM-dependent methyltransferase